MVYTSCGGSHVPAALGSPALLQASPLHPALPLPRRGKLPGSSSSRGLPLLLGRQTGSSRDWEKVAYFSRGGAGPEAHGAGQDGWHRLAESRNLPAGASADGAWLSPGSSCPCPQPRGARIREENPAPPPPAASVSPWSTWPGEGQLLSRCEFTFVNKRCFGKSSSRAVSVHTQAWWQCGPVRAFLACFCLPGDGRDAWPLGDRSCGWRGLGLAALGATGLETVGPGGPVAEGQALWRPPWG